MEQESSKGVIWALSIRQPWVELILRGVKSIELRKWTTDYRGPLWLHAPMKMADLLVPDLGEAPLFVGGYVGSAVLRTILTLDPGRWEDWRVHHCDPGPYVPGYFGWVLSDIVRFREPLPAQGKPGLFEPAAEHLPILRMLYEEAQ